MGRIHGRTKNRTLERGGFPHIRFFYLGSGFCSRVELRTIQSNCKWLKANNKPSKWRTHGNYKIKTTPKENFRIKISDEIKNNLTDIIHIITNNSNYPLEWILKLDFISFFNHLERIENDIKAKTKK